MNSPTYYIEDPIRLEDIDYEDLLISIEEHPAQTELAFLTLLKQKFAFGRIDDELVHHLIAIENDKSSLQEMLRILQGFPTKSDLLQSRRDSLNQEEASHSPTASPDEDIRNDGNEHTINQHSTESSPITVDETTQTDLLNESHETVEENTDYFIGDEPLPESTEPTVSAENPDKNNNEYIQELPEPETSKSKKSSKRKKKKTKLETLISKKAHRQKKSRPKPPEEQEIPEEKEKSFSAWLNDLEVQPGTAREFTKNKKGIKRKKIKKKTKAEKQAERSIAENEEIVSETLAFLYSQQKLYDKAIQMYEKLSLKYPEKSRFFAEKIKENQKLFKS